MKYVSHRIGDLELRRTEIPTTGKHYLEIVEWMKNEKKEDYCYTILIFEEYDEGFFVRSVGDRILLEDKMWHKFGILIKFGFEFLKKCVEDEGGEHD